MKYVIIGVVVLVVASLFVERKPGGGFRVSRRIALFQEFWTFIKERKLWWMTPIFMILILLGIFIVLTEKSMVLPFIYAVF